MISLGLSVALLLFRQEVKAEPDQQLVQAIIDELNLQVVNELSRAKRLTGLSDTDVNEIEGTLEPEVKSSAQHYAPEALVSLDRPHVLTTRLSSLIEKEIEKRKDVAARKIYAADIAARRQFWIDALLDGAVVMIDFRVGLTRQQRTEIRAILKSDWHRADQYSLYFMQRNLLPFTRIKGPQSIHPEGFPEDAVLAVLSELQRKAWTYHKQRLKRKRAEPPVIGIENQQPDSVAELTEIMTHRAMILAEQVKATPIQKRKLLLVAKDAAQTAHQARRDAIRHSISKTMQPLHWAVLNVETVDLAICHSSWHRRTTALLDDDRRVLLMKQADDRANRTHVAFVRYVTTSAADRCYLTGADQAKLFALLRRGSVDPRGSWLSENQYGHFVGIPNSELEKELKGEQLDGVKRWLDRMSQVVFHKNRAK